jgi:addiction module HigA family antidote
LKGTERPYSPGQVLREKYLAPNKCSVGKFVRLSGINSSTLRSVLDGGLLSHTAIHQLSAITSTPPRYWYYLQSDWQFFKYKSSRVDSEEIAPIVLPLLQDPKLDSPGLILDRDFIRPRGISYNSIERAFGDNNGTIRRIIQGQKRISLRMAYKLAMVFDTDVQYWLDIQSGYEIQCLLKSKRINHSEIALSLSDYLSKVQNIGLKRKQKKVCGHPGKVLVHQFIKPSGISLSDWQYLFCMSRKTLNNIVTAKSEMPLELIIKIAKAFKTDIGFWIDSQNSFYAQKALREFGKKSCKLFGIESLLKSSEEPQHPFQFLVDHFLKPMRISKPKFLKYIGVSFRRFDHVKRGYKKIDFELATRIGQALDMNPVYWINLQLEYDIHKYETSSTESITHLN